MITQFCRSELVLGTGSTAVLASCRVAVFGLGGVGSFAVEALARSGIGSFLLVDSDTLCFSNINRQLFATHSSLGRNKTEAARDRVLDINPAAKVELFTGIFGKESVDSFDFTRFDYVVDCIDTVTSKLLLVERCKAAGTPLIASMGTGNKRDPSRFEFADISETSVCPLARVMRHEVKKRGLGPLRVLYSREEPVPAMEAELRAEMAEEALKDARSDTGKPTLSKRVVPGSLPFVPSVAGLMIAGDVVRALLDRSKNSIIH